MFCKPLPAFPYQLTSQWIRGIGNRPDWENTLFFELMYLAKKAHEIEGLYITLRDENTRLRHENEFMLKLIDGRAE